MPEDPAATATAEPPKAQPAPEPKPDDKPLGEAGEKALHAEREARKEAERKIKELEPLATKARELEERDKTEAQKLTGKVDELTATNKGLEAKNLRLQVALEKKLPPELIDRLKGDSKEEIEADAEELLKLVKPEGAPDFGSGARTPADTTGDMDALIRRRSRR